MNQNIDVSSLGCDVSLAIKREDLLHPIISGNKYRKLKYTIAHVLEISQKCMLTFGGAYSNHIAAVAAAGKLNNIKTIGIISIAYSYTPCVIIKKFNVVFYGCIKTIINAVYNWR